MRRVEMSENGKFVVVHNLNPYENWYQIYDSREDAETEFQYWANMNTENELLLCELVKRHGKGEAK
jgi:hypothetical protein